MRAVSTHALLALALLTLVVSAGCADTYRVSDEPPDGVTTDAESTTTKTPTQTTPATTDDEPQKGDQFLSVSSLDESRAMQWNASKRAAFENLSDERQRVVRRAIECDCNVELSGEFSFYDKERVEVVEDDGTYYFLRVSIV
ncbi:hypothetical protein [Halorussus aquaticus]|uniref:DUF7979 domain-containing protein n=1 Tax=Halorussus aquaticus TaxID=2953748 RepID=A0ABD5Q1I6_9EURY|nr:hypothetical protein [Halorussus aquaticus]